LKKQPTCAQKEEKLKKLRIMVELWQKGLIQLRFADEAGFSLTPCVPYGWQPVGEQVGIPTKRKHLLNAFGLMSPEGKLTTFQTDKSIDSAFIAHCLDEFADEVYQKGEYTIVIWDNAPWHTADLILQKREEWEEKGLFLFYLPISSPHLNKIETLWRFIKYQWLQIQDFMSEAKLKKALLNIFSNFGCQFKIEFSMNF
jgi:hypothetical protein